MSESTSPQKSDAISSLLADSARNSAVLEVLLLGIAELLAEKRGIEDEEAVTLLRGKASELTDAFVKEMKGGTK